MASVKNKNNILLATLSMSLSFWYTASIAQTENTNNQENQTDWKTDRLSIYSSADYYSWQGDNSTGGRQTVVPVTATYRVGNAEFGLRSAWIESVNTSQGLAGKVSTISDTALSAAYTQQLNQGWGVRYNLDYNAITGKATLSGAEKNAIMDGNLVQQTRFGEGTNITPGIVVTKAINPNWAVGIGASYTYRGRYDPNGDVQNDRLDPGNETHATLQSQYATQNMLIIGGLIYTKSSATTVNKQDYFEKGDRYDANLTGIFALPYDQRLTAGLRYSTQQPDTYISNITGNFQKESRNVNGDSTYLTLEYAKTWRQKHTAKLLADLVKINANSYDQFNDLYNAGRKKWQLGVGYDYRINPKSNATFAIRKMEMQDKATPATLVDATYTGWNVSAGLNWLF